MFAKKGGIMNEINEMNDDGTFGNENNYDDLGGKNLFGSTNPNQKV